jgi:ketosteroid isomerase-like protein
MSTTRDVAQRFMDRICAQQFVEAFSLLTEDAEYTVIGKTTISGTHKGRDTVLQVLGGALGTFQQPPKLDCDTIIVEGDRAVALARGYGLGPTGVPYDQPYYALVLTVQGDEISKVTEFMDTATLEIAALGRKLVPA